MRAESHRKRTLRRQAEMEGGAAAREHQGPLATPKETLVGLRGTWP